MSLVGNHGTIIRTNYSSMGNYMNYSSYYSSMGKHIAKMFNPKRLLVSECILKLIFFVRVVGDQNQGYVSYT